MSTELTETIVRGIPVAVVRKEIKNLHLAVYPPDGRVRIAVPTALSDSAVRAAIAGRLPWIRQKQANFRRQARESEREMVTGETHWFEGRRYRLRVVEHASPPRVTVVNKSRIELLCEPGSSTEQRRAILDRWYRRHLREVIPETLATWAPVVGVVIPDWRIRRMKTKWGSWSVTERRIWLNVELAKKPRRCLEYVALHELLHVVERGHSKDFLARLDALMPDWRFVRADLGTLPLGHDHWTSFARSD